MGLFYLGSYGFMRLNADFCNDVHKQFRFGFRNRMDIHYTYLVVQHGDRIWHQPWADGTGVYLYYCGGTHRSGVFCRADPNIAAGVFPLKIAGKPALKGLSQNDLKKIIEAAFLFTAKLNTNRLKVKTTGIYAGSGSGVRS